MFFQLSKIGQGEVCPSATRFATLFFCLFLLFGTRLTAAQPPLPSGTESVVIDLPAQVSTGAKLEFSNLISNYPGFEESWIELTLLSGETSVVFTLGGINASLPANADVATVIVTDGDETYNYFVRTDGGSILIVMDDY